MEKLNQEYILSIIFSNAIQREELAIIKYRRYLEQIGDRKKNQEIYSLLKEFENDAGEHIKLLKDKMIKLSIQG